MIYLLSSKKSIIFLSVNLSIVIIAVLVWYFNPSEMKYNICFLNAHTGYYCMTCGGTRAFYSLLHWRIADAFTYNPFVILVLLPFSCFLWIQSAFYVYAGWSLSLKNNLKIICIILIAGLTFAFLRNIPSPVFAMLRPHVSSALSK